MLYTFCGRKMSKEVAKLTEAYIRKIVHETVEKILQEYSENPTQRQQELDAWNEFDKSKKIKDAKNQSDAEFDFNYNTYDLPDDMAHCYATDDPFYKSVHGSTLKDRVVSVN